MQVLGEATIDLEMPDNLPPGKSKTWAMDAAPVSARRSEIVTSKDLYHPPPGTAFLHRGDEVTSAVVHNYHEGSKDVTSELGMVVRTSNLPAIFGAA
jgi:hypothetical protein